MSERWALAGYEVLHLVDGGGAGDLWAARDLATGDLVALRRVGRGLDVEALRRTVPLQADLPYAVRLLDVVDDGPVLVLVLDHAPGGALETVLARRGSLEPGEVVTVGVPLAAAAAVGLGHGDLTAGSVLFGAEGRPLLAGLGLSGGAVDPREDVAALATLCLGLLRPVLEPGPDAAALLEALERGRCPDPGQRPDAAELAALLRDAHPAAPVRLGGVAAGQQARPAPDKRSVRPSPGQWVAGGLALLVLAGAGVGWWSGRGGEQPAPSTRTAARAAAAAPSPATSWAVVLDRLDEARAAAFAAADETVLSEVYAPDADGLAADRGLVRQLEAAGRTAVGVRHAVHDVQVLAESADRARLRVVDELPAYEVRDARGTVVGRGAPRPQRPHLVELRRTTGGWRLVSVRPD